jgi:hypothetical protein
MNRPCRIGAPRTFWCKRNAWRAYQPFQYAARGARSERGLGSASGCHQDERNLFYRPPHSILDLPKRSKQRPGDHALDMIMVLARVPSILICQCWVALPPL